MLSETEAEDEVIFFTETFVIMLEEIVIKAARATQTQDSNPDVCGSWRFKFEAGYIMVFIQCDRKYLRERCWQSLVSCSHDFLQEQEEPCIALWNTIQYVI